MKQWLVVIAAIVSVAAAIFVVKTQSNARQGAPKVVSQPMAVVDDAERYEVPVSSAQPQQGSADAPITIVEFADFQCPFCDTVRSSLHEVQKLYGDKVRVVWRNQPLPIHGQAKLAAEAALEAFAQGGNDKFWAMHDVLFAHRDKLARADLERYAAELGLDVAAFASALDTHAHGATVDADVTLGRRVGVHGTPGFFINGRPLSGARPVVAFRELIDDELTRVAKLTRAGVPASQVYASLTANARKLADPRTKNGAPTIPETVYQVPVDARDPQQGPADALVTLVMFGDFEDKFTRRAVEAVNRLRQKYSGELRVVWKDLPLAFHERSTPAATLARVAFAQGGAELFWQAHALLLANQEALTDGDLQRYGGELGVDLRTLEVALATDPFAEKFASNKALVPRLYPIATTPLTTINGRFVRGAVAPAVFEAAIEQEIGKAKALVAGGIPKSELYATIIRDGRTEDAELTPEQKAVVDKTYEMPVPSDAPSKGPVNAKIVIQEFADFQCPFCTRAEPLLAELMKAYPGKIRIVWRDYPLPIHADAALSAEAAREVYRQGKSAKFWQYHDLLFANQSALSRADLERHARSVGGVDMKAFARALDRHTHAARVKSDVDAYAKSGSKLGTPGFFINGHLIEGAQPIEFFRALIDRELAAPK